MKDCLRRTMAIVCLLGLIGLASTPVTTMRKSSIDTNQVLDWNHVFVDTLIATNTPNSSSQRLRGKRTHRFGS